MDVPLSFRLGFRSAISFCTDSFNRFFAFLFIRKLYLRRVTSNTWFMGSPGYGRGFDFPSPASGVGAARSWRFESLQPDKLRHAASLPPAGVALKDAPPRVTARTHFSDG